MERRSSLSEIWVVLEPLGGRVTDASLELLSEARRVAATKNLPLCGVSCCSGEETEVVSEEAQAYGASRLLIIPAGDTRPDATSAASVLAPAIQERSPRLVLMTTSVLGKELAARVAARTGLAMASCASFFQWQGDTLVVTVPDLQDRVSIRVRSPRANTIVATVRPGIFPASPAGEPEVALETEVLGVPKTAVAGPAVLEEVTDVAADMALDEVDVVVAGGVGLGGAEGFDLLGRLADALNGRLAASRMAVRIAR